MSGESELRLQEALTGLHAVAPDTIGDRFHFSLESAEGNTYSFRCAVGPWMANAAGTLHGGMAAAVVDQAMGFVVYAIQPGRGFSPTVELHLSFHRPLRAEGELLVKVEVLTAGKTLMHLRAEVFTAEAPGKLCVFATAVYAFVPAR